ncbi:MAG: hypothetical protein IKN38_04700, partial [Clostridia bacterium]|nr:hypothetical protein [Clostridia bacterium]
VFRFTKDLILALRLCDEGFCGALCLRETRGAVELSKIREDGFEFIKSYPCDSLLSLTEHFASDIAKITASSARELVILTDGIGTEAETAVINKITRASDEIISACAFDTSGFDARRAAVILSLEALFGYGRSL